MKDERPATETMGLMITTIDDWPMIRDKTTNKQRPITNDPAPDDQGCQQNTSSDQSDQRPVSHQ